MTAISQPAGEHTLLRRIDWKQTFWIASGVPPLVLFSIGGIAATVGTPSYIVWTLSILMGFAQSFTYAEIAGMFPNKSGGAPRWRTGTEALPSETLKLRSSVPGFHRSVPRSTRPPRR